MAQREERGAAAAEARGGTHTTGQPKPHRGKRPRDEERLIRELVDQLKHGTIEPGYFQEKYGVDILTRFRDAFDSLVRDGYTTVVNHERVTLTRDALLRVDVLLPRFFLPAHAGIRYT